MNSYSKRGVLFALIIYVLWVTAVAYFDFTHQKQRLYQTIDQQLETAAKVVPQLLPDNYHYKKMLESDSTQSSYDKKMLKLSAFTDENQVKYIYSLILRDDKVFFTSSSATKEERTSGEGLTQFFDHYDDVDPRVYEIFTTHQKTFLEYSDQWGTFRSVFIPSYSEDGTLFLAAADVSTSHIQALLKQELYETLIKALFFLVFAYPIYFVFTKSAKRIAFELQKQVKQKTTALTNSEERLAYAIKAAHQGWFDLNPQTGAIIVDDEYARTLGYEPGEFKTSMNTWFDSMHPDDVHGAKIVFQHMLETDESSAFEYRRKTKSGLWIWLQAIGEVVERDKDNNPIRVIGINADITERKEGELVLRLLAESGDVGDETLFQLMVKQLASSQNVRYALLVRHSLSVKNQGEVLAGWAGDKYCDPFTYSLIDTPCENVKSNGFCSYPDGVQALFPKDLTLVEMGAVSYQGIAIKNRYNETIGHLALLDDKPMIVRSHTNQLLQSFAVRAAIEIEHISSNKKLLLASRVFSDSHEAIFMTNVNGEIIDVNPTFTTITGYVDEDALGQNPSFMNSGKQGDQFYIDMWKEVHAEGLWHGEVSNRKKNGETYTGQLTISTLKDDDGSILNYLGMFSDITQSKEQQNKLELMAHYDVLTQLPNRTLFADRFMQAVSHSKRNETLLAVCFLDLDNFKPVNDQYGHDVGDQLLIEVARRIKSELREGDTVSRQGGDEFALLLMNLNSGAECGPLLGRLHKLLAQPYIINGQRLNIGASSGVTIYPDDDGDIDTLLRHADQAMYQAKLSGKNHYKIFNAEHDQQTIQRQVQLDEIQQALINDEFSLYYQPKVNMETGKVFGAEALIRWLHPEKGLIPPMEFLPLIDSTSLEIELGEWVINEALSQMSVWKKKGIDLEVSVNVSSYHLQDVRFIGYLDHVLAMAPEIDSTFFQLEILESSALGDIHTISRIIQRCRDELGIKMALDDFGTGYSSLTHLRSLATNTIKIDQSFVRDMLDDPSDYAIIDGVIGLADSFNREVIAEGVETTEHGLMLLTMGCYEAQGYGIARPMPAKDIVGWLADYLPNQQWQATSNKTFTDKENQLRLLKLVTQQWQQLFEKNILSEPEDIQYWPIMKKTKCSCGIWLQRAKQSSDFNKEWLRDLKLIHDDMHLLANDMRLHYQNEEYDIVRQKLAMFHSVSEHIKQIIKSELPVGCS